MKIFLIGFMGSGKSYWGNLWAQKSGLEFFDIDEMVEEEQGKAIAKIFAEDGEDHFRDLETFALKGFGGKDNIIIACGGGTACYNDNITWMNENGTSVYLQSAPENILQRLTSEIEKRPLIKNMNNDELLFYITEKIKEREFFYRQAKIILNVDEVEKDFIPKIFFLSH